MADRRFRAQPVADERINRIQREIERATLASDGDVSRVESALAGANDLAPITPSPSLGLRGRRPQSPNDAVITRGYRQARDGGGALYVWDSESSADDDGGSILAVPGISRGRWRMCVDTWVNLRAFGAVGDRTTDDTQALERALEFCKSNRYDLYAPRGRYRLTRRQLIDQPVRIRGVKPTATNNLTISWGRFPPEYMDGTVFYGDHYDDSIFQLHSFTSFPQGLDLQSIGIVGKVAGYATVSGDQWFTGGTLTVDSTASLSSSGRAYAAGVEFTYTGKTATTLTGCTITGPIINGAVVTERGLRGGQHYVTQARDVDPVTTINGAQSFPNTYLLNNQTINVASTATFPNYGLLWIDGRHIVRYTGKTATSFTGCYMEYNGVLPAPLSFTAGMSVRWYHGTAGLRVGEIGGSFTTSNHNILNDIYIANCYSGLACNFLNENHWSEIVIIGCHYGIHNQKAYTGSNSLDTTIDHPQVCASDFGIWDCGGTQNFKIKNCFINSTVMGDYTFSPTDQYITGRSRAIEFEFVYCERNVSELDASRPDTWCIAWDSTYEPLDQIKTNAWHLSNISGRMGWPIRDYGALPMGKVIDTPSLNGAQLYARDTSSLTMLHGTSDGWTDYSTTEGGNIISISPRNERMTGLALGKEAPFRTRITALQLTKHRVTISSATNSWVANIAVPYANIGDCCDVLVLNEAESNALFTYFLTRACAIATGFVQVTLFDPTSAAAIAATKAVLYIYNLRNDRGDHARKLTRFGVTTSAPASTAMDTANGDSFGSMELEVSMVPNLNCAAYAAGTKLWYIDASNYCELVPATGKLNIVVQGTTYTTPTGQTFAAGDTVEYYVATRRLLPGTGGGGPIAKIRVNGVVTTLADGTGASMKYVPRTGTVYFLQNNVGAQAFTYTSLYRIDCYKPERRPDWTL